MEQTHDSFSPLWVQYGFRQPSASLEELVSNPAPPGSHLAGCSGSTGARRPNSTVDGGTGRFQDGRGSAFARAILCFLFALFAFHKRRARSSLPALDRGARHGHGRVRREGRGMRRQTCGASRTDRPALHLRATRALLCARGGEADHSVSEPPPYSLGKV